MTNSYAITRFPSTLGDDRLITDIDTLMSRVDDRALADAAKEMIEGYRQVFPIEDLDPFIFEETVYEADGETNSEFLNYIETWDTASNIARCSTKTINATIMRRLLRKILIGLFCGDRTEPAPVYPEVSVIFPDGRPYVVAGGPDRDGFPPNEAYDAIMLIDVIDIFGKAFTSSELRNLR